MRITYRMVKNLRIAASPFMKTGPAWAVWSYFVPFVNLRSAGAGGWRSVARHL